MRFTYPQALLLFFYLFYFYFFILCLDYFAKNLHFLTVYSKIQHLEGVRCDYNKILKLDESSLPKGMKCVTENPYLLRLTLGIIMKINFGVK